MQKSGKKIVYIFILFYFVINLVSISSKYMGKDIPGKVYKNILSHPNSCFINFRYNLTFFNRHEISFR